MIELACFLLIIFVLFGRAAAQSVFLLLLFVFGLAFLVLMGMTLHH